MLRRRKTLRRRSPKLAARMVRYYELRRIFLELHPYCQIRGPGCEIRSRDIHHRKGRYGRLLNETLFWMALCRVCHDWVHDHSIEARKRGYLIRK